jgi:hypothetical protein
LRHGRDDIFAADVDFAGRNHQLLPCIELVIISI